MQSAEFKGGASNFIGMQENFAPFARVTSSHPFEKYLNTHLIGLSDSLPNINSHSFLNEL